MTIIIIEMNTVSAQLIGHAHRTSTPPTYRVSAEYKRPKMEVVSRVMVCGL